MKDKFRIGFWNYVDTGVLEEEAAADDWKALGMNMPMSFEFDPEKHDKKRMIAQLDACEQRGMKLIVCDARTRFSAYERNGEAAFTAGVKEVRAWTIHKGDTAPQAAGVIHSDFERGFIRAQTVGFDDYIAYHGEKGAQEAGKMRAEGKDYIVRDGDVMNFLFNV